MPYPKWKYHLTKEAVVIHSAEEEAALGEDWVETPAVFDVIKRAEASVGLALVEQNPADDHFHAVELEEKAQKPRRGRKPKGE